jgi:hypothetical protein
MAEAGAVANVPTAWLPVCDERRHLLVCVPIEFPKHLQLAVQRS